MRDFKKFEIMLHEWEKPRREENISNSIAHNFGVLVWLVCFNKISKTRWLKQQILESCEVQDQESGRLGFWHKPSSYKKPSSHYVPTRQESLLRSLSHHNDLTLRTSSKLKHLLKSLSQNTIRLWVKASTWILGECYPSVHNTQDWKIYLKICCLFISTANIYWKSIPSNCLARNLGLIIIVILATCTCTALSICKARF